MGAEEDLVTRGGTPCDPSVGSDVRVIHVDRIGASATSGEMAWIPVPSALATTSLVVIFSLRRNATRVPSRENTGRLSTAGPVVMAVRLAPAASVVKMSPASAYAITPL